MLLLAVKHYNHLHNTAYLQLIISQNVKIAMFYEEKAVNPFNPEFTIVIFINYKSRVAAAIIDS